MKKLLEYYSELEALLPSQGAGFSAAVLLAGETLFECHRDLASLELKVPLSRDSALLSLGIEAIHGGLHYVLSESRRDKSR